jgi:ABC-type sugar transport system substrate-binding protein
MAANRAGTTLVTGMNGMHSALRAVKDGKLAMTVDLDPRRWGRLGVAVLAEYFKGETVAPRVFVKHVIIDKTNVDARLSRN